MVGCNIFSFICSYGTVESLSLLALHHASTQVTSVLVLFIIFGGLFQFAGIHVGFHKPHLAISVVFAIALIFICCVLFTVKGSEVVDCGHEYTFHCLHFHFGQRKCPCSRRRPSVPKLLSIIVLICRLYRFFHFILLLWWPIL